MRTLIVIGALTVSATSVGAQDNSAAGQPTFRSGINLVRVNVAVSDRNGSMSDLVDSDFEILEDGKLQSIQQVELLKWRTPRTGRERSSASRRSESKEQPQSNSIDTITVPLPSVSGAYYTVVYSTSNSLTDGRFHVVEVRVKRPGALVRAAVGYRADGDKDARATAR